MLLVNSFSERYLKKANLYYFNYIKNMVSLNKLIIDQLIKILLLRYYDNF